MVSCIVFVILNLALTSMITLGACEHKCVRAMSYNCPISVYMTVDA